MKGVIFNVLEEMVEENCGMAVWNDILNQELPEGGIYTAGESYPDEQLFNLVNAVCARTKLPMEKVVGNFGEFLFTQLAARHPVFLESPADLKSFLKSIDSVIHVEVRKLYDNPNLPSFKYSEPDPDLLIMQYRSPRKLCILAEGLIRGAAAHYGQSVEISHPICIHRGADWCDLHIRFLP
ncbi:heme NO-binding domain-containing protein [Neptunomonas antarctica]|uniref:Haem-NO-binding n=1 Tax=Neptunomonas antarctica TaxID=619304 RepID=A0A1N7L5J5_9GAMM|nr:heme NO-binding domain-containing protein [Neptunomonas antarctica]SIS69122.1 Haem-NO-binding [Neptunomonas antarctica]